MKLFLSRTFKGVKKGLLTPTLPPELIKFQQKPIIRILRVVGGLSLILLLGNSYLELHWTILILLFIFTILFQIYHIYLTYHRFKHLKKILKSGELDIRNSPLDKYASMIVRVLACAKGVCESTAPIGLGLGIMLGADQVLKDGGREAFFGPLLGTGLNKILPKSNLDHWRDTYLEATNNLNNSSKSGKYITEFLEKTNDLTDISSDDKKDLLQLLTEIKQANDLDLESAKTQAMETLENKPN